MAENNQVAAIARIAAIMLDTDAGEFVSPRDRTKESRASIARSLRGQADLLRQAADVSDQMLEALQLAREYVVNVEHIALVDAAIASATGMESDELRAARARAWP